MAIYEDKDIVMSLSLAVYDDRVQLSPAACSVGVTKRTALRTPDCPSVQGTADTGQCLAMSCHVMSGKRI